MAIYPRRITSTATTITVATNDGTSWLNDNFPPSVYKASSSFTTLQSVYNSIGSAGGFAPLGIASAPGLITTNPIIATKGPIRSQMMTSDEYNTIAPRPAMIQDGITYDADNQTSVWESAAWNGYGWFWIPSGGHRTGYRNDMYLVRIADPMMVIRLYNTSPPIAATWRGGLPNPAGVAGPSYIVPQAYWGQYANDQLDGFPEWGPYGAHHYDGIQFDAATEKIIWGGDAATEITNPNDVGQLRQTRAVLSVFNVNGATPKSAWSRYAPANWASSLGHSIFGMMDRSDGTYEFSGYYPQGGGGKRYKYNPSTNAMTDTAPFSTSGAVDFGHVVRDPATNKVYETQLSGTGSKLLEIGGTLNVDIGLWEIYAGGNFSDNTAEPIIVNGKAYCFGLGADPVGATAIAPLGASRINLSTGARDLITNGLSVALKVGNASAGVPTYGMNGLHGRVGYVPSVGAFVILLSALHDVYVFRPPSSWGAI